MQEDIISETVHAVKTHSFGVPPGLAASTLRLIEATISGSYGHVRE